MASTASNRPLFIDGPFFLLVSVYVGAVAIASAVWGFSLPSPINYIGMPLVYACVFAVCGGPAILFMVFRDRPESLGAYFRLLATRWIIAERLRVALPILAGVTLFSHTFSAMKSAIPLLSEFSADPFLIEADRVLHGSDPWRLLHSIVGYPIVSFALSWIYQLWFFVMLLTTLIASLMIERPHLRAQFFTAYALCWIILGTAAATWFASVGPCFYEIYYGSDYFDPLMSYLRSASEQFQLPTLVIQESLVAWASNRENGLGRGISAMPSLHISMCVLFSIFAWKISRRWGIALTVFLLLILIGSIHLGYHYAVDGYISILVTPLLWALAGRITSSGHVRSIWRQDSLKQ